MNYMVLMVINDLDDCAPILDAWEDLGVGGVTILESTGLGRARKAGLMENLPIMPSLADFMRHPEQRHRTIFTVVDSEEFVDRIIAATEALVGDLERPDKGILFVLPVLKAKGIQGGQKRAMDMR
jgi:nitrogen regulatory protein PII